MSKFVIILNLKPFSVFWQSKHQIKLYLFIQRNEFCSIEKITSSAVLMNVLGRGESGASLLIVNVNEY